MRAARQYLGGLHLRVQIGLPTGLLSVGLVVLVSAGAAVIGQAEARRDAAGRMTQLATEMAHRLDSSLAERYREIGTLAQMGPLQGVWTGDPAVLRGVLEQLQQNFPYYAWIGFAPPGGIVRAATGGLLEGKSVAQRDWFRLASTARRWWTCMTLRCSGRCSARVRVASRPVSWISPFGGGCERCQDRCPGCAFGYGVGCQRPSQFPGAAGGNQARRCARYRHPGAVGRWPCDRWPDDW